MNVTVIGLGPMGQALAGALLNAGHHVTVWNRTEARAAALLARGAAWAQTPADALRASAVTLVNVLDNAVVDTIVGQAGDAVEGRVIVGLASDTPDKARGTATLVTALGGHYLDGAIMTPIDTIGSPGASILIAGDRTRYDQHREVFHALGSSTWLSESVERAAGYDMALLDLFWTATAGYLHALELAGNAGIEPGDFLPHALGIVDVLPAIFTDAAERVAAGRHDAATSSLTSIANSVQHLIAAAEGAGLDTAALSALSHHVGDAIDAGHGEHEVTAITQRR
jgi:3-hydroxyisobutyrate dehydrogenase-like beta-hydroxyacid dehydrogenase